MNSSNFYNNTNYTNLSMWGYLDIIEGLKSTYCMSQVEEVLKESKDCCIFSNHLDLSTPSLMIESKNRKSQPQQTDDFVWHSQASAFSKVHQNFQTSLSEKETLSEDSEECRSNAPVPKKRKRKTKELDITKKLINMRLHILDQSVSQFKSTSKKAKSDNKKRLKRRSKYIGVSKNNDNWQSLINIGQIKKYIGTFTTEMQAARAYDLYSVALRGEKGSLNFDYSVEDMLERIEYYLEHKCVKFDS